MLSAFRLDVAKTTQRDRQDAHGGREQAMAMLKKHIPFHLREKLSKAQGPIWASQRRTRAMHNASDEQQTERRQSRKQRKSMRDHEP